MGWERHVLIWIHAHGSPALDRVFLASRWLGDTDVLATLVAAVAIVLASRGRSRAAAVWIGAGLSTLAAGWALKLALARPRPQVTPWLVHPRDFSFPSGHALGTAMVFSLLASMLSARYPRRRGPLFGLAALLMFYVGIGRLYLGVHWPTDVLGGWAIGLGIAALAWRVMHAWGAFPQDFPCKPGRTEPPMARSRMTASKRQ